MMKNYIPSRYNYTNDYGMDLNPCGEYVYYFEYESLQKELDELKAHNDQLQSLLSTQEVSLNKIKADAVREAAESLCIKGSSVLPVNYTMIYKYANQLEGKE